MVGGAHQSAMLWKKLDMLAGKPASPQTVIVVIKSEQDISRARGLVKGICERYRFKSFVTQKLAAMVSELARNIVSYSPGAAIEISLGEGDDIQFTVRGSEGGSEIANLDKILSDRYRRLPGPKPTASSGAIRSEANRSEAIGRDALRHSAWESFWITLDRTAGPAFWDVEPERGALLDLSQLKELFDPNLPLVDLGCGDGRQTRALAEHWPRVVGVDISEIAVAQAGVFYPAPSVTYSPLDVLDQHNVAALHRRLGDACVYMRGLLLHLSPAEREACARGVETLLGARGTLYLIEPSPGFLGSLGAPGLESAAMPPGVRRVLERGIPVEGVGQEELAAIFPAARFEVLSSISTALEAAFEAREGGFARLPAIAWAVRPRTFRSAKAPARASSGPASAPQCARRLPTAC